jgi:HSP20 family protein
MASDIQVSEPEQQGAERTRTGNVYRPNVDIIEQPDELVLVADLPGVKRESIDIDFDDGVLTLQGKVEPRYDGQNKFLLFEYGVGDFFRTFRVSEQVDPSRIRAEYADGVLTIHLPKAETAKPRKIEVRTKGSDKAS